MSKTTLDLSTLSDIADGTHTVKVKAKADGYRDSEFSNEVSYTKAPAGIDVYSTAYGEGSSHNTYMKIGSPPTSPSDYTYGTSSKKSGIHNVPILIDKNGTQLSEPQKATLPIYIWGFGYYINDLSSWNTLEDSSYSEYIMLTADNIAKIYLGNQSML